MPGGRPRETLLDPVLTGTFRPKRYADLLDGPPLPEQPPAGAEKLGGWSPEYTAALWGKLVETQWWYVSYEGDILEHKRPEIAAEFADVMHHLHGGRLALWLREELEFKG